MSKFDDCDLAVFEAHSRVERDGGARYWQIRRAHDGHLPIQRLSGLVRRGLMTFDGYRYYLTREGVDLAHEYRDRKAAANAVG